MRRSALAMVVVVAMALPAVVHSSEREVRSPQDIFADRCAYCHEAGGWGTRVLARRVPEGQAELRQRDNLPPALTMLVVRRGIGAMPPFTPTELSDAELEALAEWLASGTPRQRP
ncbi:c-type cytochrome [Aurantiacibacter flavus]|uniref:Cytochrome c n=1 Tax=Aurantiacibacter flavus TaxID=3145232 RepID=A0ABV0CRX9_9SPHN